MFRSSNLLRWTVCVSCAVLSGLSPVALAQPQGGPKSAVHRVNAYSSDVFYVTFRAGERACVDVHGDGDTDLDLFVYDENGILIDSDTDGTDRCLVTWTPRWTGSFRIVVQNLGSVYNEYHIRAY